MRLGLLGPLEVRTEDGAPAEVSGRHPRTLLAVLACHSNRPVSTDTLQEALWGVTPPRAAPTSLRVYVHHLRRILGEGRIRLHVAGYELRVGPGELDVQEFQTLVAQGRDALAAGDTQGGAAALRSALAVWRGPALDGLRTAPVLNAAADEFEELRLDALATCFDAELALGHAEELIVELQALVARHPFREGLRGQLMVALHRAGRRADALAEYRRGRQLLRDELGIDPGAALRRLHAQILTGELPGAEAEPAPEPVVAPVEPPVTPVVPRCLPRTIADFTGRETTVRSMLKAITALGASAPAVVVVDGMAGSGKTTLALHVASLVGEQYPDAHLYVDLHGSSEQEPLAPAAALMILLRQLGVPAEAIPADPVERVGLWRSEVAKRRLLVVLDNAASSAQVADLLPPSGLALVTTRRRLAGLDGVHVESLPVLSSDEAVALLARIVGDRVHAEAEAAREVAYRCGGLPLAVRLAGARLAHRPGWRVAELVRRLDESVLPQLVAENRTVVDAFVLSYRQLSERNRWAFRLFGLYPGGTFDALAVAALTGLPLGQAEELLDELVNVHLVEEPDSGVFRLHDLIREYAATLAGALPDAERRTALLGVLDQHLHAAAATVEPARRGDLMRDLRSPTPSRPDLLAALTDPAARLERERPNLTALVEAAVTVDPAYAWRIPRAAWRYLWLCGYIEDIAGLHRRAVAAAELLGDRSAAATALHYLASTHYFRAELDEARELMLRAIRLRENLGESDAAMASVVSLASVYLLMDRWAEGRQAALVVERSPVSPAIRSTAVITLASASVRLGRYAEALRYQWRALIIAMDTGDMVRIGTILTMLATTRHQAGLAGIARTRRYLTVALRLFQRERDSSGEAEARHELANLLRLEGRYAEAVVEHRWALEVVMRLRNPWFEARFRTDFAATLRLAGDTVAARAMVEDALRIARRYRLPYLTARAEAGLAECLLATDPAQSRRLWEQVRKTFARLGAAELVDVEKRLAAAAE